MIVHNKLLTCPKVLTLLFNWVTCLSIRGQRSVALFVLWSMYHFKYSQGSIITKHSFLSTPYHWWTAKGKDDQRANETIRQRVIALKSPQCSQGKSCLSVSVSRSLLKCVRVNTRRDVFFKGDMQRFTPGPFASQPGERPQCASCTCEDPQPDSRGGTGEWTHQQFLYIQHFLSPLSCNYLCNPFTSYDCSCAQQHK